MSTHPRVEYPPCGDEYPNPGGKHSPADTWDTMGYGQQVSGTQSIGMFTCYLHYYICTLKQLPHTLVNGAIISKE